MPRSLEGRLEALEAASVPRAVGFWDIREAGTAALVETAGTPEVLPGDVWRERYPAGLLVTIEYAAVRGDDER